ncbi:MAG: endonuclease/exonuclease/phosphatase family protein [Campylobacterales bacterium]|nr:endonuclease/exonuclease/phosphatase family protein [Campylobacterales bacterium]
MLKPPEVIRSALCTEKEEALPREFGLLSWNVYKQNLGVRFNTYFEELVRQHDIDLVALQEVKINPNNRHFFDNFHFSLAPNMQFLNHIYGVLNGSRIREQESFSLLSTHRESLIRTHKSSVFSYYRLPEGGSLLLANLHAINFRATKIYNREVEMILERVRHHQGAMIVTGDFNSWNRNRMGIVLRLMESLGLRCVEMDRDYLIKSFMKHKLDHIFYRGVEVKESYVIDVERFSDHNALYARFAYES